MVVSGIDRERKRIEARNLEMEMVSAYLPWQVDLNPEDGRWPRKWCLGYRYLCPGTCTTEVLGHEVSNSKKGCYFATTKAAIYTEYSFNRILSSMK